MSCFVLASSGNSFFFFFFAQPRRWLKESTSVLCGAEYREQNFTRSAWDSMVNSRRQNWYSGRDIYSYLKKNFSMYFREKPRNSCWPVIWNMLHHLNRKYSIAIIPLFLFSVRLFAVRRKKIICTNKPQIPTRDLITALGCRPETKNRWIKCTKCVSIAFITSLWEKVSNPSASFQPQCRNRGCEIAG